MKIYVLSGMHKDRQIQEWRVWGAYMSRSAATDVASKNRLVWKVDDGDEATMVSQQEAIRFRIDEVEVSA